MIKKISKQNILVYIFIAFGIFLRLLFITKFPAGLNCDEASSSYEAYSILNTLHDRNNYLLPVYLMSWGSGQNALLTYLSVPFVKLLGLNILATRLPMAIISSLTVIVFYKLIYTIDDKEWNDSFVKILFATLFFVLNPWHIMKSRWALESNLLPDFIIFGIYFLIKFFKASKPRYLYIGFASLSISAYAYSTAFLGLPIFTILFFIYCCIKKHLKIRQIVFSFIIVLLITWPLILFIAVNTFDLDDINLVFLSIPKLRVNRLFGESIVNNKNVLVILFQNFINTLKLLVFQSDDIYWNGIKGIGMYYLFSFPFLIAGLVKYFKDRATIRACIGKDIMLLWFISGIAVCLSLREININRANFVIIPTIYFIAEGFSILLNVKKVRCIPFILLGISFIIFSYKYIDFNMKKSNNILIDGYNSRRVDCFVCGFDTLIPYLDKETKFSSIHIGGIVNEPHIYVLYYTKYNPDDFYSQKVLINKKGSFNNIRQFGKWNFEKSNLITKDKQIAYVFDKRVKNLIDEKSFNILEFGNYIIANYKGD